MTTTQRGLTLEAFLAPRRHRAFVWGEHDCCLMAADWVQAVTGIDHAFGLRGAYRDAPGAARIAREWFGPLEAPDLFGAERWPGTIAGLAEVPAAYARRGDLVALLARAVADGAAHVALGVCTGAEAAAAGPAGLQFVPMAQWRRAWRVEP